MTNEQTSNSSLMKVYRIAGRLGQIDSDRMDQIDPLRIG